MEKKDLLKKQKLAEELGMKFDEASELFSGETLETMKMINVVGGDGDVIKNCEGGHCGNCVSGCSNKKKCNQHKDKDTCPTDNNINVKGYACVGQTTSPEEELPTSELEGDLSTSEPGGDDIISTT